MPPNTAELHQVVYLNFRLPAQDGRLIVSPLLARFLIKWSGLSATLIKNRKKNKLHNSIDFYLFSPRTKTKNPWKSKFELFTNTTFNSQLTSFYSTCKVPNSVCIITINCLWKKTPCNQNHNTNIKSNFHMTLKNCFPEHLWSVSSTSNWKDQNKHCALSCLKHL